jgi:hypothetical protein
MRQWLKTALDKLAENLAAWIATVVGAALIALCVYFWSWLKTEHSLRTYGWMWVVGVSVVGGLPALILWFLGKKRPDILYRDHEEISVVLRSKLRKYDGQKKNEILIDFRLCDTKWGFPKGSAKRLLPALVEEDKTWRIKDSGGNAMTIIREDPRVTVLKHLNRE